jgi:leucine dehydrogenase
MVSLWALPDFDAHEGVHVFHNADSGLRAIIAIHSTHLGPAAGGARFWHYADERDAITDALRLSRGMSFKNAMAGLPMGGGKGVILADPQRTKTPAMLEAFGRAIDSLGGRYVTAEDVGMGEADLAAIGRETRHVSGLPVGADAAGGDPGPVTATGVFLGVKAAIAHALGRSDASGIHVAIQGVGSVGGGLARLLAAEGARLTLADLDATKAAALARDLGASAVPAAEILGIDADVMSPCALGAVLNEASIASLRTPIVAGGANNQLATPEDGDRLHARGILYAPDYVINAGGIINVALEYLGKENRADVERRVAQIPERLDTVWRESAATGETAARVADRMAMRLIGRA